MTGASEQVPGGVVPGSGVTADDLALLEWTRRRMLGRAAWVAATTTAGGLALGGLLTWMTGAIAASIGLLLGAGAFRSARGAYAFDHERLLVDRLLRRRDPAWRIDAEGVLFLAPLSAAGISGLAGATEALYTATGPLGGHTCRLGALHLTAGTAKEDLLVVELARTGEAAPAVTFKLADGRQAAAAWTAEVAYVVLWRTTERRPSLFRSAEACGSLARQAADLALVLRLGEAAATGKAGVAPG